MISDFNHARYDAIIVGARCAGAATALLMARNGARVLLVDRETALSDTLSTHSLLRPAVTLLDQWGLLSAIEKAGTPALHTTQFHYGPERVDLPNNSAGIATGLFAPRRWLLDRVIRDAAVHAGAELHTGTAFVSLDKSASGRVTGASLRRANGSFRTVQADIVIGADGRQSSVAQCAGSIVTARSGIRAATVYTYVDGLPNEGYRWYFGDRVAAGLIPTNDGAHCLFASCPPGAFGECFGWDAFAGVTQILSIWEPEIAANLEKRGHIEKLRRFPGAPGFIRTCAGPGWALVGDAGFFKDPATAHGITDAFLDAHRLSRALNSSPGDASAYQLERDRFAPAIFELTQRIASLDWSYSSLKALHMGLTDCLKAEQNDLLSRTVAIAA